LSLSLIIYAMLSDVNSHYLYLKPLRQLSRSPHITDLITRAARLFILCGIVSRERGKFNFGEVFLTRREWRCHFYIKSQRQGQNAL